MFEPTTMLFTLLLHWICTVLIMLFQTQFNSILAKWNRLNLISRISKNCCPPQTFNSVLSNECPNSAYNTFLHIYIYKHACNKAFPLKCQNVTQTSSANLGLHNTIWNDRYDTIQYNTISFILRRIQIIVNISSFELFTDNVWILNSSMNKCRLLHANIRNQTVHNSRPYYIKKNYCKDILLSRTSKWH